MTAERPKSPSRAAAGLARHLAEQFAAGSLAVGVKLPSERELAARFGLSRGAVRRVVERYVAQGVLRRTPGSGTFVAAVPGGGHAPALSPVAIGNVSPSELMEARLLLEPLLPTLIVRHATPVDFARLAHCLDEAERAASFEEFEYWDGALHEALSQAAHNGFLALTLRLMTEVRDAGEWGRMKREALTPARRARYQRQHRAIVDALRDRDARAASAAIAEHLRDVRASLFDPRTAD